MSLDTGSQLVNVIRFSSVVQAEGHSSQDQCGGDDIFHDVAFSKLFCGVECC